MNKTKKVYGLYLPYHKSEFLDGADPDYESTPEYPVEFRRYRLYSNPGDQLNGYANTMCPASQMFTCNENEVEQTVKDLDAKFQDKEWLKTNIYPYV